MNTFTIITTGYFLYNLNLFNMIRLSKDIILTPKYIYNAIKRNKKKINIEECLKNQAIEIVDLKFKILELKNPNTNYGYELI